MKNKLVLLACVLGIGSARAQGGWTKIGGSNPVTSFYTGGYYKGAAWVDVNNDGKMDLFAMPNFLFLNKDSGNFVQLTGLNINPTPYQVPGGCSWGDINNDGWIDFITAQNPTEIYLNNGDTTFTNISGNLPALNGYASWGSALGDVNNDNKLDLLYAHAYGFHSGAASSPCKLFLQETDSFVFTPVTGYAFTDSLKPYTVPYFSDYDLDGDMDLFIASGPGGSAGPDFCYRNMKMETGLDTLFRMNSEPWATEAQDGQCYNFVDTDNDGDLDMCLTNYSGAPSRFYINNGSGNYMALSTPFTTTSQKLSNCWGDYDNDGDLDVIITSDNSPLRYYINNGNNNFTQAASTINVSTGSNAAINSDYDNDGDLDVFIHGFGAARSLWRNDTLTQNRGWINLLLKGIQSNKSAIGAIVKLKAKINGVDTWQTRTITAQNSFQGQNDLRVHFGVNDASTVDSILVLWPSGTKEVYTNVTPNQFLTYIEGAGTPLSVAASDKIGVTCFPVPAKEELTIIMEKAILSCKMEVYNSVGVLVKSEVVSGRSFKLNTSGFSTGVYWIIIDSGNGKVVKKFSVIP